MIKGLAITPPILGRISIGRVIEKMASVCQRKTISSPLPVKYRVRTVGLNTPWMSNCVIKHRIKSYVASLYV